MRTRRSPVARNASPVVAENEQPRQSLLYLVVERPVPDDTKLFQPYHDQFLNLLVTVFMDTHYDAKFDQLSKTSISEGLSSTPRDTPFWNEYRKLTLHEDIKFCWHLGARLTFLNTICKILTVSREYVPSPTLLNSMEAFHQAAAHEFIVRVERYAELRAMAVSDIQRAVR